MARSKKKSLDAFRMKSESPGKARGRRKLKPTFEEFRAVLEPLGYEPHELVKVAEQLFFKKADAGKLLVFTTLPLTGRRGWGRRSKAAYFDCARVVLHSADDETCRAGPARVEFEAGWPERLSAKVVEFEKLLQQVGSWPCPGCDGAMSVRYNKKSGEPFFSCTNWPGCEGTRPVYEVGLEHQKRMATVRQLTGMAPMAPMECIKCGAPMVQRVARTGYYKGKRFWGCSNFPECRMIYRPELDRPDDDESGDQQ